MKRVLAIVLLLLGLLCWALVILRAPRIVAAQPATPLERIGPNADRSLHPGEVGWLIAEPGVPDVARQCDGCELALLDCATVCTYRVIARRLDWVARVGEVEARQGGRAWLPLVIH